ncbi:hypothetical protein DCO58_07645 [Helicobacter saguini]|uniref:Group III truncated hemoglobin n=1 Tax=Helicobacter saguini TaxID=1548018 RepID=A0A347VNE9_9HELI|nr:group III truncated hemoglobin [Helicobacter saguini]MWV61795.1 hypothetical protein [Helicobacter saguini]MWV67530.1 hypothetical protein [Helicobacter saguini]MWV69882.1 hypothetical protein [Helicobacter saguini]MWV72901.1 hypothetical protein [Helicobacter saguini]TLD93255.1 group III truncated hemoglobin [Helicobacter saguini]
MKFSEVNDDSINELMDVFYNKVRINPELGPIFNGKVGTDEASWDAHKAKIASFWRLQLLGEQGYNGYPMKAHLELDPFPREFFNTWLGLFEESLNEVYDNPECVGLVLSRANMIAARFQKMMYEFPH